MVANRSFWYRFETALIYLGITLFALVAILPFLNTIARSFSAEPPIMRGDVYLWPLGFNVDAYIRLMQGNQFWIAYRNSFIITIGGRRCKWY